MGRGGEVRHWDKDTAEIASYPKVSTPESNLSAILKEPNRRSVMFAHANTHTNAHVHRQRQGW